MLQLPRFPDLLMWYVNLVGIYQRTKITNYIWTTCLQQFHFFLNTYTCVGTVRANIFSVLRMISDKDLKSIWKIQFHKYDAKLKTFVPYCLLSMAFARLVSK